MIRKRSVAVELRLKAEAEARRAAQKKLKMIAIRFVTGFLAVVLTLILGATDVLSTDSVIKEVHSNQLKKLIRTKDFVAVFWYARNCRMCENVLEDLETIDDDAEKFSIDFVKINDKRLAKSYGVQKFPALTFFKDEEITIYEGDLGDERAVLDFLTNDDSLSIPDKIEEVNAETLTMIIGSESFVAALFFDGSRRSSDALQDLENIDDEADIFGIRFVRINDPDLSEEFSLKDVPALVYFRHGIPVVYHGDLLDETEVLEWLIQHQSSIHDEDVVESVTEKELDVMIGSIDHLLVFFHDNSKHSKKALAALEHIDDDCDKIGVSFVESDDADVSEKHGVNEFPTLVYFEGELPSIYEGDLTDNDEVMEWLVEMVEGSTIDEVTDRMLSKLITNEEKLAVLFYNEEDDESEEILEQLEDIDDELDTRGVPFVKINDAHVADEFGIETLPMLVLFEKGIPNLYQGDLSDEESLLEWITAEISGDHTVEVVSDAMLKMMVSQFDHVAALFYDKKQRKSLKVIQALESIDDRVAKSPGVKLVKIDDPEEAADFGIRKFPALIYFEKKIPNVYQGDIEDSDSILKWILSIAQDDHIEEVNADILDQLLQDHSNLVVYFYDKFNIHDVRHLEDLETIDDDLERENLPFVRVPDTGALAEEYGIDVVPALVLFKDGEPKVYEGDVAIEEKAIRWIRKKMQEDES